MFMAEKPAAGRVHLKPLKNRGQMSVDEIRRNRQLPQTKTETNLPAYPNSLFANNRLTGKKYFLHRF
jgi:hypothetical protein